jgi:hypothetical protein
MYEKISMAEIVEHEPWIHRQTLDRQTLDRQTLDTTNPGHNKPWTDKPWTRQTLNAQLCKIGFFAFREIRNNDESDFHFAKFCEIPQNFVKFCCNLFREIS